MSKAILFDVKARNAIRDPRQEQQRFSTAERRAATARAGERVA